MTLVHLGENSKLTALPSERKQARKFYLDVLGCEQTRKSEGVDVFKIGSNFNLGVIYDERALSLPERMKSIWLEGVVTGTSVWRLDRLTRTTDFTLRSLLAMFRKSCREGHALLAEKLNAVGC